MTPAASPRVRAATADVINAAKRIEQAVQAGHPAGNAHRAYIEAQVRLWRVRASERARDAA